jgi:hypothetical protein
MRLEHNPVRAADKGCSATSMPGASRLTRHRNGNPAFMVAVLIVIVTVNLVLGAFVIAISISSDRSMRAE